MKRNVTCKLAGAALVIVLAASFVSPALAYFTTYTSASGGAAIAVKPEPKPTETVEGLTKTVTIQNTADCPCFVRVRVFYPGNGFVSMTGPESGEWKKGESDEYWYYSKVLQKNDTTSGLVVSFTRKVGYENDFHVIVVEEYTPALYDEEKGGYYANWDLAIPSGTGGEDE